MLDFDAFEVSSKEEDDLSASEIWFPPERMLAEVIDEHEDSELDVNSNYSKEEIAPGIGCTGEIVLELIDVAIGPCLLEVLFTGKAYEGHRKYIDHG